MHAESPLGRGLRLLDAVARSGEISATDAATAVGLPVSTTYRYLRELVEGGYLREEGHLFGVGPAVTGLVGRSSVALRVAHEAPRAAAALTAQVHESTAVLARVGDRATVVARSEPARTDTHAYALHEMLPLHAGAGQRVLLAWAPGNVVRRTLADHLVRFTARTPIADDLPGLLEATRRTGFAVSRGEVEDGAVSVAVPVLFQGEVVCSLDVSSAAARVDTPGRVRALTGALTAASQRMSEALDRWAAAAPPFLRPTDTGAPAGGAPTWPDAADDASPTDARAS